MKIYQDKDGNLWVASFDGKSISLSFTEKRSGRICSACSTTAGPLSTGHHGPLRCRRRQRCGYHRNEQDSGCTTCPTHTVSLYHDFSTLKTLSLGSIKQMTEARREGNVWVIPEGCNLIYELGREGMQMKHFPHPEPSGKGPKTFLPRLTRTVTAHSGQVPTTGCLLFLCTTTNGIRSAIH